MYLLDSNTKLRRICSQVFIDSSAILLADANFLIHVPISWRSEMIHETYMTVPILLRPLLQEL